MTAQNQIVNLTPHVVTVRDSFGVDHVYPPSGLVARVGVTTTPDCTLADGTPTTRVEYGRAELPEMPLLDGVTVVVSSYFGSHPERGEGDALVYVMVPTGAVVSAAHSSSYRRLVVDGIEYENDAMDPFLVDIRCRYIVSTMFADAYRAQHRTRDTGIVDDVELFVPDSGPSAIRANGQIVAVTSLIRR